MKQKGTKEDDDMTYVDGFVLPVPKKKLNAYRKMAAAGAKVWKKYGALEYFECVGDDLHPTMGGMKARTFPQLAKPKKGETVMFSFIVYKSKAHRNQVNAKVMKEWEAQTKHKKVTMPFDAKRMAYGGFRTIVQRRSA